MPIPVPDMYVFGPKDSFDDPDIRAKFKDNVLSIAMKFGALTPDDLVTNGITVAGPVNLNGHEITNISEAMGVVNLGEVTTPLHTLVAAADPGTVFLIPPHFSYGVSHSVDWEDDMHLLGCGNSSVIFARTDVGTAAGFEMIKVTNKNRWSFRNFRLIGKRTFHTQGTAIHLLNCRDADGIIENVIMGPIDGNAVTNSPPSTGIDVENSSGIMMTSVIVRGCSGTGIDMHTESASSVVEQVDIVECRVEDNVGVGIRAAGVVDCLIKRTKLKLNSGTNIWGYESSSLIISDNRIQNASAGSAGTKDNISIEGNASTHTVGCMVMNNHVVEGSIPTKETRHHIHLHTQGGSHLVYGNHMNDTTGGRSLLDNSTESTRDANHLRDAGHRVKAFGEVGAWQTFSTSKAPAAEYSQTYAQNLYSHEKGAVVSSIADSEDSSAILGPNTELVRWSDTGDFDEAKEITLPEAVDRMGNKGSLLTPTHLHTGSTRTELENACLQATYNIVQRPFNLWAGSYINTPNLRSKTIQWWTWWAEPTDGAGITVAKLKDMRTSVLSAYFHSGSVIQIAGYSIGTTTAGVHRDFAQRPTWAVIHQ